jgi:hypothetical protein
MTWALIIWSALMAIWIIGGASSTDCGQYADEASKSGCEAGTGIGVAALVFLWFLGFVVLGLVWFMTRPKDRRICPACGFAAKKGQTACANCGYDFAAAAAPGGNAAPPGASPG